jgi:hypothetical protein
MRFSGDQLSHLRKDVQALLDHVNEDLSPTPAPIRDACALWTSHADALLFHLKRPEGSIELVGIFGGTGTGKSTLVNYLLKAEITATSMRRTFTTGPVAVVHDQQSLPADWLGIEHRTIADTDWPARGEMQTLTVAQLQQPPTEHWPVVIDTPDIDGDEPAHQAEADRVFRWARAAVFVVTPEKYQMAEMVGYYRLAQRYSLPCWFVMNKCEHAEVVEDFRSELVSMGFKEIQLYEVPRFDASYVPAPQAGVDSLRNRLADAASQGQSIPEPGIKNRAADVLSRCIDQILSPLQNGRQGIDHVCNLLDEMKPRAQHLDVSPLASDLQKQMQEESILYLMGPQRVIERVRQVPGLLAHLPRTAWELLSNPRDTQNKQPSADEATKSKKASVPAFDQILTNQFIVLQNQIEDVIRNEDRLAQWVDWSDPACQSARIDPQQAGVIAQEELQAFRDWLEQRAQGKPRDTRAVERLLKFLPGTGRISKLSEAAPYLLTLAVVTHGAFLGPLDLMIIGGFSAATWLTEKLSNEVASRARQTNRQIRERFEQLMIAQIQQSRAWLSSLLPEKSQLRKIQQAADRLASRLE